jgi:hypothetical protein
MRKKVLLTLVALLVAGCDDFPKDSYGTLERLRGGGAMRIGIVHNPPWVRAENGQVGGVEPALAAEWARRLGAPVRFVPGHVDDLVEALNEREIDVLLAGFARATPHGARLALSQPYLTTRIYLAVAPGQTHPADWEGHRVAVDPARPGLVGKVRQGGAVPVPLQEGGDAMAGYDFEVGKRGFEPVGRELAKEERTIAVIPGENALLLSLDAFLQEKGEDAIRAMAAEASP